MAGESPKRDKHPSGIHDFSDEIRKVGPIADQDRLFAYFIRTIIIIMMLYGAGMIAIILFGPEAIALRMVTAFSIMFTGVLGLGSGYLLGKRNGD